MLTQEQIDFFHANGYLIMRNMIRGAELELLREQAQRAVRTHVPQRGEKLRLVELAAQNARHLLEERRLVSRTSGNRAPDALYDLQEALELQRVPRMIVCFDISIRFFSSRMYGLVSASDFIAGLLVFDQ